MSPHSLLGISRSATLAEIKKAYARLLKQNRPDDDPVAFQRLQQAYEICIARARERAEREARAVAINPANGQVLAQEEEDEDDEFDFDLGEELPKGHAAASPPKHEGDPGAPASEPETLGPPPAETELPIRPPVRRAPLFPPVDAPAPEPIKRAVRILEPALSADRREALFDQMLTLASQKGSQALAAWLQCNEDWYSLQAKEQSAGPLIERLVRDSGGLELASLQVLIEFFDLASTRMDPRLRNLGQELFARERFLRGVSEIKRRHGTWIDRVLWRELSMPHERLRRLALLAAPTLPARLRSLALEVLAIDDELALTVLDSQALDFWLPLTTPHQLDWRAPLSALAQILVVVAPVVGAIVWMAGEGWTLWSVFTGELAFFGMLVWLLRRGHAVATHRLALWRLKRTGSMEQLAGGSVLQDPASVVTLALVLMSMLVCGLRGVGVIEGAGSEWVTLLATSSLPFMILYRRLRWEMALMSLLVVVTVNHAIGTLLPRLTEPAGNDLALALCAAALACVGVDLLRARRSEVSIPVARANVNPLALVLVAFAIFALVIMPAPRVEPVQAKPVPAATLPPVQAVPLHRPEQDTSFASVAEAFAAVRKKASPRQGPQTRYRSFYIAKGELRGAWLFGGGDFKSGPTGYARVLPPDAEHAQPQLRLRCDDEEEACVRFRREHGAVKPDVDWTALVEGGSLSFDSPGVAPAHCDCDAPAQASTQLKGAAAPRSWVKLRVLFDDRGRVVFVEEVESSSDKAFNKAAVDKAYGWKIQPGRVDGRREGGAITRTIEARS